MIEQCLNGAHEIIDLCFIQRLIFCISRSWFFCCKHVSGRIYAKGSDSIKTHQEMSEFQNLGSVFLFFIHIPCIFNFVILPAPLCSTQYINTRKHLRFKPYCYVRRKPTFLLLCTAGSVRGRCVSGSERAADRVSTSVTHTHRLLMFQPSVRTELSPNPCCHPLQLLTVSVKDGITEI